MQESKKKETTKREYPPFYEKAVPIALALIAVGIIALLIISIVVVLGQ